MLFALLISPTIHMIKRQKLSMDFTATLTLVPISGENLGAEFIKFSILATSLNADTFVTHPLSRQWARATNDAQARRKEAVSSRPFPRP